MNKIIKILNIEPDGYSSKAKEILKSFASVQETQLPRSELLPLLKDYDVIIVRLGYSIDSEFLSYSERLQIIVSATTGLNHIDLVEAKNRGITVLSLKGESDFLKNIHATAEHTWALLLATIRHLPEAYHHVKSGHWNRDLFKGSELFGKTLGLIGFGRLGSIVADYGKAFGMRVIANDLKSNLQDDRIKMMDMDEMLAQADVVSLHANYTPENAKMINSRRFSAMKTGTVFINTSRGELVDEFALVSALKSKKLKGAGIDVINNEVRDLKNSPLIEYAKTHDNLIVTPHIGGATFESTEATEIFMARKLADYYGKAIGKFA